MSTHIRGLLLALLACLAGSPALAQVFVPDVVNEEGTQFVREAPPTAQPNPPAPRPTVPAAAAAARPPQPALPPEPYPTVVLLVDTSDSMLNEIPGRGRTRLDEAMEALRGVEQDMKPETRLQLWSFNSILSPHPLEGGEGGGGEGSSQGFVTLGKKNSPVRANFRARLKGLRTAAGTNLYMAVVKTLDIFNNPADVPLYKSGERFPVLVVVSDGEDWGQSPYTLAAVEAARRKVPWVTIHIIGFYVSPNDPQYAALCKIATHPEGCAAAENPQQLAAILASFYRPPKK
ncbi:MAG: VWA domain-containing protein [Deltaproteobacteria bacterium]|nr:VWA domain-containing protein [Deltaproteobacteria bacterium]